MNSYKYIPFWENTRRIKVLREFRNDTITYFSNSKAMGLGKGRIENTDAVQMRKRINLTSNQAHHIIAAAGIATTVTYTPPAMIGGRVHRIDVFSNMFGLGRFHMTSKHLVDFIDRAIGVYQFDRTAALRRTFNPFWWLKRSLLWLLSVPFVFLGELGFDADRAEGSVFGRIFKLLLATSAVLTILNYMGWLSAAKALLGIE